MSVRPGLALVLLLLATAVSPSVASAGWAFTAAYHLPLAPDHEHNTTFFASVRFLNDTAQINGSEGNGTGTNGTGTNGTGTNGTGTNGTGTNGTGTNGTGTNGTGTNGTGTNGTGTNGTGTNGTGTNGTGTNGTGTNGTGTNGTGTNGTVNVTTCMLVIEPPSNTSSVPPAYHNLTRVGSTDEFALTLGPWPPGHEFSYHFEANLSNGSVVRSNSSWHRTPVMLSPAWHLDLGEASVLARALQRPLLVLVYSDTDHSTRDMDENVFSRPGVLARMAGFVCARVSNDTDPDFGALHHVRRLPTVLFLNATDGSERDRLENPIGGRLLEREMDYIAGKGARPSRAPLPGIAYRAETLALGICLVAGPATMYVFLRYRRKRFG